MTMMMMGTRIRNRNTMFLLPLCVFFFFNLEIICAVSFVQKAFSPSYCVREGVARVEEVNFLERGDLHNRGNYITPKIYLKKNTTTAKRLSLLLYCISLYRSVFSVLFSFFFSFYVGGGWEGESFGLHDREVNEVFYFTVVWSICITLSLCGATHTTWSRTNFTSW